MFATLTKLISKKYLIQQSYEKNRLNCYRKLNKVKSVSYLVECRINICIEIVCDVFEVFILQNFVLQNNVTL